MTAFLLSVSDKKGVSRFSRVGYPSKYKLIKDGRPVQAAFLLIFEKDIVDNGDGLNNRADNKQKLHTPSPPRTNLRGKPTTV